MLFKSLTVLSFSIFTESTEGLRAHLEGAFSSSSSALAQLQELTMRIEVNRVPLFGILVPQWADQTPEEDDPVSFADVLPFLKRLPTLTHISLAVKFLTPHTSTRALSFDVCNDDLRAVAATWPRLVRLALVHAAPSRTQSLSLSSASVSGGATPTAKWPPLSALVALAERCRGLETVDVEFAIVGTAELARLESRTGAAAHRRRH